MRNRDGQGRNQKVVIKRVKGREEKAQAGRCKQTLLPHQPNSFLDVFRQSLVDPGWPRIHYVLEDDLELLFFLPLPLQC